MELATSAVNFGEPAYPGHSDQGTERGSYDEAERIALTLAEEKGLSVWYEENPQDGRRTLVKSFRNSN